MANPKRYPVAKNILQMTTMLELDAGRVLRRAGLSRDFLDEEDGGATASEYFALWEAAFEEIGNPNFALEVGQKFAGSPFVPAMLAFSSSPNTEVGLKRLALFKPLVGPVRLDVKRVGETVEFTIGSSDDDVPMPVEASSFELVYFVETVRMCTGYHVVPLSVGIPKALKLWSRLKNILGSPRNVPIWPRLF